MSDALLRFENVTKSYGDFTVFSDISLEVHEKEVVSIIGSSGSGKTTLLRCINLLEPFEAGKIILDGQEIGYHDVNGKRKRVPEKVIAQQRSMTGMVFQQFNLFPHMTAKKNVMLGLTHTKKMPKAEAEALAEKWLTAVGLGDKMDNLPSELSGGQQQRVAIARALALHPDILCFDEPTSALDPELTGEVLRVLRELADRKTTMIIVTHEMHFARDVADRILFMDGGVVVEQGEVREIFANPKTAAARRLVAPNGGSAARDLSSFAPDDHVVRVTFNGSSTAKPLVASLAAEKGILVSVLSADTRDLSGQCYGSMLLKLPADLDEAKQAAAYMRAQPGITVEEVTGE